jgi:hypothetical protein
MNGDHDSPSEDVLSKSTIPLITYCQVVYFDSPYTKYLNIEWPDGETMW